MDDILVIEAANHVDNGIGHADVGEELVAKTFALAGTLDQTGDVNELDDGGSGLLGVVHLGELVQTGVGTATTPVLGSLVQKG